MSPLPTLPETTPRHSVFLHFASRALYARSCARTFCLFPDDEPELFLIGDTPSSEDDPFEWGGDIDQDHHIMSGRELFCSPDEQTSQSVAIWYHLPPSLARGNITNAAMDPADSEIDRPDQSHPGTIGPLMRGSGIPRWILGLAYQNLDEAKQVCRTGPAATLCAQSPAPKRPAPCLDSPRPKTAE